MFKYNARKLLFSILSILSTVATSQQLRHSVQHFHGFVQLGMNGLTYYEDSSAYWNGKKYFSSDGPHGILKHDYCLVQFIACLWEGSGGLVVRACDRTSRHGFDT
jgi:hypothetical protein